MKLVFILAGILIFGVLIAVHELGHFVAAKLSGVKVEEFSIGMGPLLWEKQKGETRYSLRALPIGGFCAMGGEDEDTGSERSFVRQGFWKKLVILAAGSGMNFVVGFLVVVLLYGTAAGFYVDQVAGFAPEFQLQGEDGLMEGDVFYQINGYRTYLRGDAAMFLSYHQGDTIDLVMLRDGEKVALEDFPMARKTYTGTTGESYTGFGIYVGAYLDEVNFLGRLKYCWYQTLDFVQTVWFSLVQLITGGASVEDLSGPVGIVSAMTEMGTSAETPAIAWNNIFYFAALLAVNLSVMNLLPIPALDGGRIFFLLLDAAAMLLFKRRIPEKYQAGINAVFFVLLMGFMLLITFKDVFVLFR